MGQRLDLQALLESLPGVAKVYFQPQGQLIYPCIVYERSDSYVSRADNMLYWRKKRYDLTVIDRDPDSPIPDRVEGLLYSKFDRFFQKDGLNHFVFQLFF